MLRRDLDSLDLSQRHSLKFADSHTQTERVFLNLSVVSASAITPSSRGNETTVYLVRVADRRHLWPMYLVNKAFNLKLTPTGNYRAEDLVGSEPKTWQDMIDEIWEVLPEADTHDAPTLPVSPDGNPDGFDFFGISADIALQQVLDRIGCELAYDPIMDEFAIETIGDTESKALYDQAVNALDSQRVRVDDEEPIIANLGRIPRSVTVFFPIDPPAAYGENPWHTIEIEDPDMAILGQEAGTTIALFDDASANYQGSTLANEIDLEARAESRALEYFKSLRKDGPASARMVFAGLRNEFAIGSWVNQYQWRDTGKGYQTEVWIHDTRKIQKWPGNKVQVWRETEAIRLTGSTTSVSISGSGAVTFLNGFVEIRDEATNEITDRFACLVRGDTNSGDTSEVVGKWTGHVNGKPVYFLEKFGEAVVCQTFLKGPISHISGYTNGVRQALTKTAFNCLEFVDIQECSGSGGSSGSGGGGDGSEVTVACCSNPLPTTLYATFGGAYADGLGTIPLTWNGSFWLSETQVVDLGCSGGDTTVFFYLTCFGGNWYLFSSSGGSEGPGPALTVESCDPLYLTGQAGTISGCSSIVYVSITETSP